LVARLNLASFFPLSKVITSGSFPKFPEKVVVGRLALTFDCSRLLSIKAPAKQNN